MLALDLVLYIYHNDGYMVPSNIRYECIFSVHLQVTVYYDICICLNN